MTTQVQLRRGTFNQNNTFTGAVGEITVDTTVKSIRIHDGSTQGGHLLSPILAINNQTTTSYTIVQSDIGKKIRINTASTSTIVIPLNSATAIGIGTEIKIRQVGVGPVIISPSLGVSLNTPAGFTSTISTVGGEVSLHKVNTNEWDISGDLSV